VAGLAVIVGIAEKFAHETQRSRSPIALAALASSTCAPITCIKASAKNSRPPDD
jgi:hypothetical protein